MIAQNVIVYLRDKDCKKLLDEPVDKFSKAFPDKEKRNKVKLEVIKLIDNYHKVKTDKGRKQNLNKIAALFVDEKDKVKKDKVDKKEAKKTVAENRKKINKASSDLKSQLESIDTKNMSTSDKQKLSGFLASFDEKTKSKPSYGVRTRGEY